MNNQYETYINDKQLSPKEYVCFTMII